MLPAAHRMRAAADFTDTTRRGRKVTRGCVVVYALSTSEPAEPAVPGRAGLIVGKVVGNSVQRHRAARRMRAVLAGQVGDLPGGTRVVVRALPGADTSPGLAGDLVDALQAALAKARR